MNSEAASCSLKIGLGALTPVFATQAEVQLWVVDMQEDRLPGSQRAIFHSAALRRLRTVGYKLDLMEVFDHRDCPHTDG